MLDTPKQSILWCFNRGELNAEGRANDYAREERPAYLDDAIALPAVLDGAQTH